MNFKEKVIEIVNKIPYGRVTTYGTVAILANFPRGAKFVGGVLHFNSEKYNLPWQRIVNRDGFISTRCPQHLKVLQKALLEQEGIEVSDDFMIDLQKYGWWGQKEYLDNSKLEE